MHRTRHAFDHVRSHVRSLWTVIALQSAIVFALAWGWSQAPRQLTVHVPPDLRAGAVLAIDEVPPPNVYAFAYYLFQQLNRWPDDGAKDYDRAITRLAAYLTPKFEAFLRADVQQKATQGELSFRVRGIQEVPGHAYTESRVELLPNATWLVWLDVELAESVKGMTVKHTAIRYPLRIIHHAVDWEANPWGLVLDGYAADGPTRLSPAELKEPFVRPSHAR